MPGRQAALASWTRLSSFCASRSSSRSANTTPGTRIPGTIPCRISHFTAEICLSGTSDTVHLPSDVEDDGAAEPTRLPPDDKPVPGGGLELEADPVAGGIENLPRHAGRHLLAAEGHLSHPGGEKLPGGEEEDGLVEEVHQQVLGQVSPGGKRDLSG